MAELTDAQRKRAEARQRRRGQAESGSADGGGGEAPAESQGSDEQPLDAVKHAAKVAAAGAAVGAAAAAARALTSNRGDDGAEVPEAEEEAPSRDEQASPETEEPARPEEDDAERREPEPEPEPEPTRKPEPERDPEPQREPVEGAAPGDAKATIDRAREQLEELLERPVESVSSLERTHDGWVVALEVVEFQRVPESMDVLASYEMELDEDRNLRRYQKVRRYHRAEADREEGP